MKVIGIAVSQGVYEGTPFHNVNFHCTEPLENDKGTGLKAKTVKVKYRIISEILGKQPTEKEIFAFVGKELLFFYDEYKNVAHVQGITA